MAAINFPDSPSVNDTYTVGDKTWRWDGNYWRILALPSDIDTLIKDADNDTKVQVEESADEDVIRFDIAGTEKMTLDGFGLDVVDDLDVHGNITVDGQTNIGGHVIPDTDVTYDLGSATYRFRDLYLSGSSIDLGGVSITSDGTNLTLPPISNISGDFTVDTDTLHVDSANDRVGIGTTSPTTTFHVDGNIRSDGNITFFDVVDGASNTPVLQYEGNFLINAGTGEVQMYTSQLSVVGSLNVDGSTLQVDSTNNRVGIGTAIPSVPLDVNGVINSNGTRVPVSSDIHEIVKLTQSAYDALTPDANTLYVIVG